MSQEIPTRHGDDPELCALCPKLCRFACPVASATADEGATPTAMFAGVRMAQAGEISWQAAADNLAKCTGCSACKAPCEFDQDVPDMLYKARSLAWQQGAIEAGSARLHEHFLKHGNPYSSDLNSSLAEFTSEADYQRKGRVLFWPGCRALAKHPARVASTLRLLRLLGADHVSLPARKDVPECCGGPLRTIGDETGLQTVASGLHQYFNRQRTWVTASSSCLGTVSQGYRDAGLSVNAELLHLGEYLLFFRARLATLGREAQEARTKTAKAPTPHIFIHDACGLQRRWARGTAVHQVVETLTGNSARSLAAGPGRTHCCGAGDFFDARCVDSAEAVGRWAAKAQPAPSGAWIVTGDSDCVDSLQSAYPRNPVMGLSGLLERWVKPITDPG